MIFTISVHTYADDLYQFEWSMHISSLLCKITYKDTQLPVSCVFGTCTKLLRWAKACPSTSKSLYLSIWPCHNTLSMSSSQIALAYCVCIVRRTCLSANTVYIQLVKIILHACLNYSTMQGWAEYSTALKAQLHGSILGNKKQLVQILAAKGLSMSKLSLQPNQTQTDRQFWSNSA